MGVIKQGDNNIKGYVTSTPPWAKWMLFSVVVVLLGFAIYTDPGHPIPTFNLGDTVVFKADPTLKGVIKDIKCRGGHRRCDYVVSFAAGKDRIRTHSMGEYELLPTN